MNEGLLSKRYAKALLEYAVGSGKEDVFYDRMRLLVDNMAALPRIREILCNPVVTASEKSALIASAAGGNDGDGFERFIDLVMANRREHAIRETALSYISLYRRCKHITAVTITTVNPLSDVLLERVRTSLELRTGSIVEIRNMTDVSITGGFIFSIDDFVLDASVAGQLSKIRKQLLSENRRIV